MGCCAQTNLGQNAFNLNVPGIRFDPSQRMNQREIVDKREVSGENFIRISIYHKTLGKEHFMKKEFAQAVIEYSKAIVTIFFRLFITKMFSANHLCRIIARR